MIQLRLLIVARRKPGLIEQDVRSFVILANANERQTGRTVPEDDGRTEQRRRGERRVLHGSDGRQGAERGSDCFNLASQHFVLESGEKARPEKVYKYKA